MLEAKTVATELLIELVMAATTAAVAEQLYAVVTQLPPPEL
jgi:hypothetical protein